MMENYNKNNAGFTIIELVVVIAIIGILASIITASVIQMIEKARIAKAKSEVEALFKAISIKLGDTGYYPYDDGANNITYAAAFNAKLAPFLSSIGTDPWGSNYFYDGCPCEPPSSCNNPANPNCEGGPYQTSIRSAGPDKAYGSFNVAPPDGDDIIIFFNPPGLKSW